MLLAKLHPSKKFKQEQEIFEEKLTTIKSKGYHLDRVEHLRKVYESPDELLNTKSL